MQGLHVYAPRGQTARTRTGRFNPNQNATEKPDPAWLRINAEPALSDILSDPVITQVMAKDRVKKADIDRLIEGLKNRPAMKTH